MILRRFMKDVVLPVAVAIALAILIQGVIAKPYQIPTPSMDPTIAPGDRVIANRVIYKFRDIERGDIIVFRPTDAARRTCGDTNPDVPFVKRVIGLPGDRLQLVPGKPDVIVNDTITYIAPNARANPGSPDAGGPQQFTVPEGRVFVLGDNRPDSCDSHQWEDPWVPLENVIGQAEITYFPIRHVKFLS